MLFPTELTRAIKKPHVEKMRYYTFWYKKALGYLV